MVGTVRKQDVEDSGSHGERRRKVAQRHYVWCERAAWRWSLSLHFPDRPKPDCWSSWNIFRVSHQRGMLYQEVFFFFFKGIHSPFFLNCLVIDLHKIPYVFGCFGAVRLKNQMSRPTGRDRMQRSVASVSDWEREAGPESLLPAGVPAQLPDSPLSSLSKLGSVTIHGNFRSSRLNVLWSIPQGNRKSHTS